MIARALMGTPDAARPRGPVGRARSPRHAAVGQAIAGLTVLIAEERLALASAAADRIVLVEDTDVFDAPRAEALAHERALSEAYVNVR